MSVNSRVKASYIIGQRKAFYSQRIPEPGCVRKKYADIDILVVSGFDNKPQKYFSIYIFTIMITVTTKFSLKSL